MASPARAPAGRAGEAPAGRAEKAPTGEGAAKKGAVSRSGANEAERPSGGQRRDLVEFFNPTAVALVGSVNRNADPEKLRAHYTERWGDRWYLVNAKGGAVGDIPVHRHVTDIPAAVSLAVVNVGTRLVARTVEECGRHGVPYVLIFTAGFSETGAEGARLEAEVGEIARRHGIRVFGPNTNTNAFEELPSPPRRRGGRIGLVTQSGHQGRPIVQGAEFGAAFSRWVPTGNELDYEAADFIEYFAHDDDTDVIAGYFEGFKDPAKLRRALEAANAARKPVVAIKIGSTQAGTRMASSHTGHLAGSDTVVDGLFRQYGVVRVRDLDELLETAALFAKLPAGTGGRCCLYSISGGSGALMAEVAESHGVAVPALAPATQRALRAMIPDYLTVANPVDNGAQFLVSNPVEDRRRVFDLVCADPGVDLVVVGLTGALGRLTDRFAADIAAFADSLAKPVVCTWNSFKTDEPGFRTLVESGVPLFRSFRNCFAAIRAFADYGEAARHFRVRRAPGGAARARRAPALAALLDEVAPGGSEGGPRVVGVDGARGILGAFGVPLAGDEVVTSAAGAVRAAERMGVGGRGVDRGAGARGAGGRGAGARGGLQGGLGGSGAGGGRVVMKIASPDFPHKSDAGLVRLGVSSLGEARRVFGELTARAREVDPTARLEGVQVQQQVPPGTEMIVGASRDPVFGPVVLVGTGGVFAEVLADVAVRPLPIDRRDAEDMVASLRGAALLAGARGRPPADTKALVDVIMAVARLAAACGDRLVELDLNPVVVGARGQGALAVDHLVVVDGRDGRDGREGRDGRDGGAGTGRAGAGRAAGDSRRAAGK